MVEQAVSLPQRRFSQDIESSSINKVFLDTQKITTWEQAEGWIERCMEQYLNETLDSDSGECFEALLTLAVKCKHKRLYYNPEGFVPSYILPASYLAECLIRYRSRGGLIETIQNQHTPRRDIFIAWKLGFIDDEEFKKTPPMHRKGKYPLKKRRERKPAQK